MRWSCANHSFALRKLQSLFISSSFEFRRRSSMKSFEWLYFINHLTKVKSLTFKNEKYFVCESLDICSIWCKKSSSLITLCLNSSTLFFSWYSFAIKKKVINCRLFKTLSFVEELLSCCTIEVYSLLAKFFIYNFIEKSTSFFVLEIFKSICESWLNSKKLKISS